MHYIIGRKEYVSYFAEFVMGELICIEAPDYVQKEDIEKLVLELNYELVAVGKIKIENEFVQRMTMQDFTEKYLYLRENHRLMSGSIKEMDQYCTAIEKFYKSVKPG